MKNQSMVLQTGLKRHIQKVYATNFRCSSISGNSYLGKLETALKS